MIKRNILEKLEMYMESKEILGIIGTRQVGKTTLMKMLFEKLEDSKKEFINFENQKILNLFETNIDEFIEQYVKPNNYLFIDEIQYSKNGGRNLKYIYDEYNVKIVISRSSATDLSLQSFSFLVGRILIFEVYPLTFEEHIGYKDENLLKMYQRGVVKETVDFLENQFEDFLKYGGYPRAVISNKKEEKEDILKNLVNSYLLKEIREVLSFENSFEYERLLETLAIKNATILNKSSVSSETGINITKLNFMINILEKTYVINKLRPVYTQKIKELIKTPKIYFIDLGFRNALLENFTKSTLRIDKGLIYETFIFSELIKYGYKPQFYNYKNSSEIDFIIEKNGKKIAFEIKSNLTNSNIDKSYRTYIERNNPDKFYILNQNVFSTQKVNGTEIIFTHFLNLYSILENN